MGLSTKRILVFGNPLVKEDSLPPKLLPKLRKEFPELEFVEFDAAENLESEGEELAIIDSVKGIERVRIIESIDSLYESKRYSMHDFDLAITLKLLKKMSLVKRVRIFGVPAEYDEGRAFAELKALIKASLF
ncbi:hypothetical protein DRN67_00275 [Candidatus Micrarchaeota archaeon]|nr:MAG: hypothetical protein DRN67_00275 [Candidatus Micrarchaeota archaeon]